MPTEREDPVVFEVEGRKHVAWVAARKAKLLEKCLHEHDLKSMRLGFELSDLKAQIEVLEHQVKLLQEELAHARESVGA